MSSARNKRLKIACISSWKAFNIALYLSKTIINIQYGADKSDHQTGYQIDNSKQ